MKLYSVQGSFCNHDYYYYIDFGTYDDSNLAKLQKEKWERFFKNKKSEFDNRYENLYSDDEEYDELWSEYYKDKQKFGPVFDFESIVILETSLNNDDISSKFLDFDQDFQKSIKDYSIKFNREQNLNNILNEPKV